MFPLHDRTRRWICRAGFLLGGVLPMMAVLAWSASINTAAHKESVRAGLEAALGLQVRFGEVSYPRPGITLISNLELADPETGESLLSTRLLEIDGDDRAQTLVASQPEINAARLERLWPLVAHRLECRVDASQPIVRIVAAELTLHSPQGVQTLVDCAAQLESVDSGRMASATFQLAGAGAAEPARLCVLRKNSAGDSSTTLKLDTGGTPLACSLLAPLLHRGNYLGANSTICGAVWADETSAGWEAEFAGQLDQIDLHAAISDQFPHQLGGTATLKFDRAVIRDGRLEEAAGTLHAGPGVVSASLLRAAVDSLRLKAGKAFDSSDTVTAYEELAAAFAVDTKGLTIRGQCGAADSGTILRSHEGVLLSESSGSASPVTALVQTLVPDSRVQVPATRQTDWLMRALPLPDVLPRDPNSAPSARLRGGPDLR